VVKPGDRLFLNDGLVQLLVDRVEGKEVHCTVAVGGELRSRKGLNLPRINLGISAFTDHDRKCLEFALGCGVDALSQSFVENGVYAITEQPVTDGQRQRGVEVIARRNGRHPSHTIEEIVQKRLLDFFYRQTGARSAEAR
jgi:pyruvate kinase